MDKKWKRADVSIPVFYGRSGMGQVENQEISKDGFILNMEEDKLKMFVEKGAQTGELLKVEMEIFEILEDNRFTAEILKLEKGKMDFEVAIVQIKEMAVRNRAKLYEYIFHMQNEMKISGVKKDKRIFERKEALVNVKYDIAARKGGVIDPDSFVFHPQLPFYGRILDVSEGGLRFFKDIESTVNIGDILEILTDVPEILEDQHFLAEVVADRGATKGEIFGCTFFKIKRSYRDLLINYVAKKR